MSKTYIQKFLTIILPQELEEKRNERAQVAYERKKKLTKLQGEGCKGETWPIIRYPWNCQVLKFYKLGSCLQFCSRILSQ